MTGNELLKHLQDIKNDNPNFLNNEIAVYVRTSPRKHDLRTLRYVSHFPTGLNGIDYLEISTDTVIQNFNY
jgi:hypothetical protein